MLHEIIFIIALSSEDFLRRLQILVNGPLSRNFRLCSGWCWMLNPMKLCNILPTICKIMLLQPSNKNDDPNTVEQL